MSSPGRQEAIPSTGRRVAPACSSAAAGARALTRHYTVSRGLFKPKGLVRALDGVSFTRRRGRTLAVVGESGCGKSTLARQVTMIERPTSGELLLDGADVAHADAAERKRLRPLVQMVFQNPYASLNPRKKVGTLLEEPLAINTDLDAAARREAARAHDGARGPAPRALPAAIRTCSRAASGSASPSPAR